MRRRGHPQSKMRTGYRDGFLVLRRLRGGLCECLRGSLEYDWCETILDRLDVNTAGGIRDVLEAIHAIGTPAGTSQTRLTPPGRSN
jgi:hypothetical protein